MENKKKIQRNYLRVANKVGTGRKKNPVNKLVREMS